MASFPKDQFDEIPRDGSRVGAHRAPGRRGRGWLAFGWAIVAVAVLTTGGLLMLSMLNPQIELFPLDRETPAIEEPPVIETMPPVTDPAAVDPAVLDALSISVLNGTPTEGLAALAATQIANAGWPAPSPAAADDRAETETIVYYSDPASEGIARGIMQLMGAADARLTDAFPLASITVVLGSDYIPPAG